MINDATVTVRVSHVFQAAAEQVFDAWLDARRGGQWLFVTPTGRNVRCEMDARVGGRFVITDRRDGEDVEHTGTYLELARPRRLAFTFAVPKYSADSSHVTIDLVPRGPNACELTLTNDDVPESFARGTEEGWRGILSGLEAVLATPDTIAATVIALERSALDRWGKGDPDGFLEISDAAVVYFDPFVPARLDSRESLRALYDGLRGQVFMTGYDMIAPKVQVCGDMAVLTFNFVSHGTEGDMRWNTTEVYQRRGGDWRIVHTHWSLTQPKLADPM